MNAREAIEQMMKDSQNNQSTLAKLVGMKNQSNVSEALKRDMKISLFVRFAEAMGYEVVIQKKKQGMRRNGQLVIERSEKE